MTSFRAAISFLAILAAGAPGAAFCEQDPASPRWIWTDFEIVGQRSITREQVLDSPPIELGAAYESDRETLGAWCRGLEERLGLHHARCAPLRFADGKSYLVINIVERGDEERARFRAEPKDDLELATPEIRDLFDKLEKRQWALFEEGKPSPESAHQGFLDYDDPEMHGYVTKLRALVPPHRENLLEVIARDKDAADRGAAARLLNWAGDVTDSLARVHLHLDDPSVLVRNNITRFMLHYVDRLASRKVRRAVTGTLAAMLERPSHADRNKAVYALLNLAKAYPEDRAYLSQAAGGSLRRIASQSILENVRDPARETLSILESDTEMTEGLSDLERKTRQARADLAQKLSIPEDEIKVARAREVTWRNSSLGCPEKGAFYTQALVPGYLIVLRVGGKSYRFHGDQKGSVFYCERPSPSKPLPR